MPRLLCQDALASHVCFRARAVDHVIPGSSDTKIAGARDLIKMEVYRRSYSYSTLHDCVAYVLSVL